jgi:multidrug transporter EmrE-like cation transporter
MSSAIIYLIISIVTVSAAQLFLKKGMLEMGELNLSLSQAGSLILSILQNKLLVAGTIFFIISYVFYLLALSKMELSVAQPFSMAAGIVLVVLGSWAFLGESLVLRQIIGIALITIGIFLLISK